MNKYILFIIINSIFLNCSSNSKYAEYSICGETIVFREIPLKLKRFISKNYPNYELLEPSMISLDKLPCEMWSRFRLNKCEVPTCINVDFDKDSLSDYALLLRATEKNGSFRWKLVILFQKNDKYLIKYEEYLIESNLFSNSQYLFLRYLPMGQHTPADTPFTGYLWIPKAGFCLLDNKNYKMKYYYYEDDKFYNGFITH